MEPRPIRMPDELWNALEEDAKAHNRMAAEHVRHICREYLEEDTQPVEKRLAEIEQQLARLDELEQRVAELESHRQAATAETSSQAEEASGITERVSEATSEGASGSTAEATESRSQTTPSRSTADPRRSRTQQIDPEPIEQLDDVLVKARQDHGQYDDSPEGQRRLAALRDALEHIRAEEKVAKEALREALAAEYAPRGETEEVWWAETIQPGLKIATEWGLVVALSSGDLEWIGPPSS